MAARRGGPMERGKLPAAPSLLALPIALLITLLIALIAGCRPTTPGAAGSPGPSSTAGEVTYTATDYEIAGPDRLQAGLVRVRLINQGAHAHQVAFLKLAETRTVADVLAARRAGTVGDIPAFATWSGGVNVIDGGKESV